MALKNPPFVQKPIEPNGFFHQTWVKWFERIVECINRTGFAAYFDATTQTTPISATANTWTSITVDASTVVNTWIPRGVTALWDSSGNKVDLSELSLGSDLLIEVTISVNPTVNNSYFETRLNSSGNFTKQVDRVDMDNGSGVYYTRTVLLPFFVGSEAVRTSDLTVEVRCSVNSSIKVNGVKVSVL